MFSQLGLTQPLTGGLELKPELEELAQDHQLPQKLWFIQASSTLALCQGRDRHMQCHMTSAVTEVGTAPASSEPGEGSHKSFLPREAEKRGHRKEVAFSWNMTDEEFVQAGRWGGRSR